MVCVVLGSLCLVWCGVLHAERSIPSAGVHEEGSQHNLLCSFVVTKPLDGAATHFSEQPLGVALAPCPLPPHSHKSLLLLRLSDPRISSSYEVTFNVLDKTGTLYIENGFVARLRIITMQMAPFHARTRKGVVW